MTDSTDAIPIEGPAGGPAASPAGAATTWTAEEIASQPRVWREVAADRGADRARTDAFLAPLLARPELRVVLTGAGTSAFAGEVLAPALRRRLARRVDAVATTDVVGDPRGCFGEDVPTLLVSFARSGDSPESVATTELAEALLTEVHHLVITCNPDGELGRRHGGAGRSLVLVMPAGTNDRGFAMTSSFTSMVLSALLVLDPGALDAAGVDRLADAAQHVLDERAADVTALAGAGHRRVVQLGSGPLAGLARESALKLLELTAGRLASTSETSLGLRHGPKSFVDEETLTVVVVANDPHTRRYDLDIAAELRASWGVDRVLVVAGRDAGDLPAGAWVLPGVADVPDAALALPLVVVAQLFALGSSLALGLTPDDPFPSGEVNRVVRGVVLHPLGADPA